MYHFRNIDELYLGTTLNRLRQTVSFAMQHHLPKIAEISFVLFRTHSVKFTESKYLLVNMQQIVYVAVYEFGP